MTVRSLFNKTATATAFAAALTFAGACAHHGSATAGATDYGHVAPAESSVSSAAATPIAGPAKVDSTGNVYTSSAAPGSGNASNLGTNTNVNVIPAKEASSTVAYSQEPVTAPPPPVEVAAVPPPPPPAPVVEEAPVAPPAPEVVAPTPHRRMRKD